MEARRREPFEREPGERTEPRLVETGGTEITGRIDLVRWGPTWAGFFVTLATTALLLLLGAAIGLTAGATTPATAVGITGAGIWTPISLIIGLMVGGFVMMRVAATRGPTVAITHGALLWAVTLVLGSLLAALGLGAVFGGMPPGGGPGAIPGGAPGSDTAGTARPALIGLVVGLGGAVLGAWMGDRARRPERAELVQRAAA